MVTDINLPDLSRMVEKTLDGLEARLQRHLKQMVYIPGNRKAINVAYSTPVRVDRGYAIFSRDWDRAVLDLEKRLSWCAVEAGTSDLDVTVTWHTEDMLPDGRLLMEVRSR